MRASGLLRSFAMAVAVLFAASAPALAQVTTGTIAGTVKDVQGAVIPGATVQLVNDAQGTKSSAIVTSSAGDFVFPNISVGVYSIEVTLTGFKTLKRSGIVLGAGDRVQLGALIIEVGVVSETVEVRSASPMVQSQTGERSFTVQTSAVESLPISNRSFVQLASLAPGVAGTGNNPARIGGGGANNVMMDGISTMDTGSNSVLLQMNVESIAEVKVLTSSYQAEYGRSSGLQITATTKSGTNRFRARYTTSSAAPAGIPTRTPTSSTAIRRAKSTNATGASRLAAPSASREAGTSYSSSSARSSHRARRATTCSASVCRPSSSVRATSQRPRTTSADPTPTSRIHCSPARVRR